MRYITLKEVETRKYQHQMNPRMGIPPRDKWEIVKLNYRETIENMCCEVVGSPQGQVGFDRETNKKGLRILRALDKAALGNVLVLEDADWEYLKGRLAFYPWGWADQAFEDFCEAVEMAVKDAPAVTEEASEDALDGEAALLNGGLRPSLVVEREAGGVE